MQDRNLKTQKHAGIEIMRGGYLRRAVIEILAQDPHPVEGGRVWYNATESQWRASWEQPDGSVRVDHYVSGAELAAVIAGLDSRLSTAIADEAGRAVAAEASVLTDAKAYADALNNAARAYTDQKVADLVDGAPETLNTLHELAAALRENPEVLTALEAQITAQITALRNDLVTEAVRALDAEQALEAAVAREVADRAAAIGAEAAARETAVSGLSDRLTSVENQVNGKIGNLGDYQGAPQPTLVGMVNDVLSKVGQEAIRAQTAENAIATDVATIQQQVASLQAASAATDGSVTALVTALNDREKTFKALAPATRFVFPHNLDAEHYLMDYKVVGVDGKFCNDVVVVEETDSNTLTFYAPEPVLLKASIMKLGISVNAAA
jgi:hypothetical protein